MWLGAAAGLMGYVRWQDGVFAVVPVLDLLWISWQERSGPAAGRFRAAARDLVGFGLAAFVVFSPQLMFWKAVYGQWVQPADPGAGFHPALIPPFIVDVVFSAQPGPGEYHAGHRAGDHRPRTLHVAAPACRPRAGRRTAGADLGERRRRDLVGRRRLRRAPIREFDVVFALGLGGLLSMMQRLPLLAPGHDPVRVSPLQRGIHDGLPGREPPVG